MSVQSAQDARVSKLLAEIQDQPSPEEAWTKWMMIDIFLFDGLIILAFIIFLLIHDMYLLIEVGSISIAFGAVYMHMKDNKKHGRISGRDFLDAQTIIGDTEINEQIPINY